MNYNVDDPTQESIGPVIKQEQKKDVPDKKPTTRPSIVGIDLSD